jgi:hypothetical protein
MLDDLNQLPPGPYKVKELAMACGVCARTMRRHINRLGSIARKQIGHYFMWPDVKEILQRLGYT